MIKFYQKVTTEKSAIVHICTEHSNYSDDTEK